MIFYISDEKTLIAFLWVHPYEYKNQNRFYIHAIAVNNDYRKRGVAKKIYQYAFSQLKKDSVLYTHVDSSNLVSLKLHEAMGFQNEIIQYVKRLTQSSGGKIYQ